jgi:hypothetical protein
MKTKTKLLKLQTAIVVLLLSVLGFSCQKEKYSAPEYGCPVPEYGVQPTLFIDHGEVEIIKTEENESN